MRLPDSVVTLTEVTGIQPSEAYAFVKTLGLDNDGRLISVTIEADGTITALYEACNGCGQVLDKSAYLTDEVWLSIWPDNDGKLCYDCITQRLGHEPTDAERKKMH